MSLPGGLTWGGEGVATNEEIVACFDALDWAEIIGHNWGTCPRDCEANWKPTTGTYINGVMLTLDFDYIMGYLIEAVDRETSQCTYIAIVQYHGRRADGTFQKDWMVWPGTRKFSEPGDSSIAKWAVDSIYDTVEAHISG